MKKSIFAPNIDAPYVYVSKWGTVFECDKHNLSSEIKMSGIPKNHSNALQDVAEFAGMHAATVYPYLNGFAGYDTLRFVEKS